MEFRWLAILTLWTLLIGPVMDASSGNARPKARPSHARITSAR